MKNENQVDLVTLRNDVAESVVRAYGAERAYAKSLTVHFGFSWYDVEASDTTETAKTVTAEKLELYRVLKGAKHSNPSTVWARVRKYGREEIEGESNPEGGSNPEGEGNGAGNSARSPMLRNIEELTALYKFNHRQDNLDEKIKNANLLIVKALEALGVDLNTVK